MKSSDKRPLTNEELEVCNRQLERINARNEWLEFQLEHNKLMLDKGLRLNYEKTIREYKDNKKDLDEELARNKDVVKQVQEQIENGVEIKNVSEVSEVSIEEKEDNESRERAYIG